jgi:hypothetical protein
VCPNIPKVRESKQWFVLDPVAEVLLHFFYLSSSIKADTHEVTLTEDPKKKKEAESSEGAEGLVVTGTGLTLLPAPEDAAAEGNEEVNDEDDEEDYDEEDEDEGSEGNHQSVSRSFIFEC